MSAGRRCMRAENLDSTISVMETADNAAPFFLVCLLLAQSGHPVAYPPMSAFAGEADVPYLSP